MPPMPLLTLRNVDLSYGPTAVLLHQASLVVESKERICLIGRNGAGKSSLFKLLTQEITCDRGEIERAPNLQVATLIQDIPKDLSGTVFEVVAQGLDPTLADWEIEYRVDALLSKMTLPGQALVSTLSGGFVRRVLLARALISEPDILLLDEPTNHLDIETIAWLETILLKYNKTLIFITHDRLLLDKIATRIIEIDHGQLISWKGNYTDYLKNKEIQLAAEAKQQALFDKKLADEERWIRQGIQARRTRNEGRVRQLEALRREKSQQQARLGTVKLQAQSCALSGKLVAELENISHRYEDRTIIRHFSATVMRGDKIGIIGANGCGKSTLLNIFLQHLVPDQGQVKLGSQLTISYFDQQREQLDDDKSVMENICEGCDFVTLQGKSVHVMSYLSDFLFSPQRARLPVKVLSGGERHRLLLARLFTRPSNVLILDEPTNDLDAETLELLEERLVNYPGTLLLVSHDRTFLNHIVTATWAFEADGQLKEYVGGYDDYLRQRPESIQEITKKNQDFCHSTIAPPEKTLNSAEKRELAQLLLTIEQLEAEQGQLHAILAQPDCYQKEKNSLKTLQNQSKSLENALATAYHLWAQLEAKN